VRLLAIIPEAFGGFGGIALEAAIRRALRRPWQIPDGLGFFSYEGFRERLQDIIGGPRVETASAA
jgi:hypothetical protein